MDSTQESIFYFYICLVNIKYMKKIDFESLYNATAIYGVYNRMRYDERGYEEKLYDYNESTLRLNDVYVEKEAEELYSGLRYDTSSKKFSINVINQKVIRVVVNGRLYYIRCNVNSIMNYSGNSLKNVLKNAVKIMSYDSMVHHAKDAIRSVKWKIKII